MNNNANLYHDTVMELETRTDNEKAIPSQSILTIMKDFIDSVNEMDETVLIPSRLMDIKVDNCDAMVMNGNGLIGEKSAAPASLSMIPTSMAAGEHQDQISLHTYYSMLKAVKLELARGPTSGDGMENEQEIERGDDDDEDGDDVTGMNAESARLQAATARAFREHLRGLFNILTHLTGVSKQLTNIYQQETGDHQSCLKPKTQSFIV